MSRWIRNPDVVTREEADGMHLAFNVAKGAGLILNPVSHFIFTKAVDVDDPAVIAADLSGAFDFAVGAPSAGELERLVADHVALLERTMLLLRGEA
jgi:hypothetical protein